MRKTQIAILSTLLLLGVSCSPPIQEHRLTEQDVIEHHIKQKAEHDALPTIREHKILAKHKKGIQFENAVKDAVEYER